MPKKSNIDPKPQCVQTDVGGSSFEHYMIYVNCVFKIDAYSFAEIQDYYDKYRLYGKITYEKVV